MAENVGGIVWTAEMKTENLVQATNDIVNAASKVGSTFSDLEKKSLKLTDATNSISLKYQAASNTIQEYISQQVLLGRSITKNGTVLDANGNEITDVTQKAKTVNY